MPIRFFIALIPPQDIRDYADRVIQELTDRFQTRTAKAPPHVTLQPPFEWEMDQVSQLEDRLQQFVQGRSPVPVAISGFGAFAPRVLYLNVLKTQELLALQSELAMDLEQIGIFDPKGKQRGFSPHLTVASRNINKSTFKAAWAELQPRSVEFEFAGDRLILLIHDGQRWQVRSEFGLNQKESQNAVG
ncbi:2'-5' RNA ligase family protein [Leptolyngbya ohadii]|uniref:2'-5' RNA ligase family protein n=1 Tax=Leptolyngbya ohadii TaxID=1962290 RepID=UPI000B5A0823|nr:2'-5' RNA ligase family protein [Leptolyngbya ohadii]